MPRGAAEKDRSGKIAGCNLRDITIAVGEDAAEDDADKTVVHQIRTTIPARSEHAVVRRRALVGQTTEHTPIIVVDIRVVVVIKDLADIVGKDIVTGAGSTTVERGQRQVAG